MDIFASLAIRRPERIAIGAFHDFVRSARQASRTNERPDLDALEAGLNGAADGAEPARALAAIGAARGLPLDHARHVLQAARLDLERPGCRSWSDLLLRCRYGAAPIGRFALDLHGEDRALGPAADALCTALHIAEALSRDTAIVPTDWLRRADGSPRAAIDRTLDGIGRLVAAAAPLAASAATRGIRVDAIAATARIRALTGRLARRDPPAHLPMGRMTLLWLAAWLRA
ncbi:MAG: hypothetical protein EXQ92_02550 [Alphaproteobacteria bacterium]|nr:hypothetical protein [Alphaproteobacteria bacterium]